MCFQKKTSVNFLLKTIWEKKAINWFIKTLIDIFVRKKQLPKNKVTISGLDDNNGCFEKFLPNRSFEVTQFWLLAQALYSKLLSDSSSNKCGDCCSLNRKTPQFHSSDVHSIVYWMNWNFAQFSYISTFIHLTIWRHYKIMYGEVNKSWQKAFWKKIIYTKFWVYKNYGRRNWIRSSNSWVKWSSCPTDWNGKFKNWYTV